VIGRFPGEISALSLIWAVLKLASRGWPGVAVTRRAVAEIERLRRALAADELLSGPTADEDVIAASDDNDTELRPNRFTRTKDATACATLSLDGRNCRRSERFHRACRRTTGYLAGYPPCGDVRLQAGLAGYCRCGMSSG
jgi:hypothetical protein